MKKIYFILGIHNHQPVGNFLHVLDKAYKDSYLPFLNVMERHPKFKWSLHLSGMLWDYVAESHPEYMKSIGKMVDAGQVELLGGGYYEPIISSIPAADTIGQIEKLTNFLYSEFHTKTRGMWLAERIWEPHLPGIISRSGIDYTIVDDAHFAAAGMDIEKLKGYYVTEHEGNPLSIFPISQRLRYYIPFQPVEKTIEYLAQRANDSPGSAIVMADDGEKFGLWPETYKHVYEDGWLDRFLSAIEQNSDWIETITFSEYMSRHPAAGRCYLPAASYFEMSEWSLPVQAQEEFENIIKEFEPRPDVRRYLRGGFWRNFLTKYPESNNMHKKMLYVSEKLQNAVSSRRTQERLRSAKDSLYAGQCNCAYWHGVFGGLYLPHLRTAIYKELLKAESAVKTKPSWKEFDFDKDGRQEYIFESKFQNLYFAPAQGGSLFEWDIMSLGVNIGNTLTRRNEAYHKRLREFLSNPPVSSNGVKTIHDMVKVKEDNLDQYLHYDWYRRSSVLDHFLHPDTKFEDFCRNQYGEQGDFILGDYETKIEGEKLVLKREGAIWDNKNPIHVGITKEIIPAGEGITIRYNIKNMEKNEIQAMFAPEFNYAFSYRTQSDNGAIENTDEWIRRDDHFEFDLAMKFNKPVTLWVHPLETVSLSEGGFEKTYQGTVVVPLYRLKIPANSAVNINIDIKIKPLTAS